MKERKTKRRKSDRRKSTRRKSIGERRKKNDSWSKEISRKSRGYG